LANILQSEETSLIYLGLNNSSIDDEGAELLATSLENNTKLETLYITGNNITKRGKGAFLKLLLDASSIENAYNSNHTLMDLLFETHGIINDETDRHIKSQH